MELEYSDKNSRRSKVYIGVGVIVALLVAATVYLALQANGLTGDSTQTSGYVFLALSVRYEALADGARYGAFQFQILADGQPVGGPASALFLSRSHTAMILAPA